MRSLGVRLWFSAQMAGYGVVANPLRSGLTVLGVAIGVASVVSLMGIGEGARQAVLRQFKSLGSNVVVVKAHDPAVEFEAEEASGLVDRVQGLEMATPVVHTRAVMRWRRTRGNVEILGVNHQFPEVRDHPLVAGHFFTRWHVEQRSPVVVLGYNVARALMGGRSPVGQSLTLEGRTYRILGILAPKGQGNGDGIDDKILIPYTTAQRIAGKKTVEEIWGKAGSAGEADLAVVQLGRIFRRKLGLDQKAPTPVSPGGEGPGPDVPPGKPVMGKAVIVREKVMPGGEPKQPNAGRQNALSLSEGKDLITITSLNQLVALYAGHRPGTGGACLTCPSLVHCT